MPRLVNRKLLVRSIDVMILTDLIVKEILDSSSDEESEKMDRDSETSSEDEFMTTAIARTYAAESRYLSPRQNLPKTKELADLIFKSDDATFKRNARMTREAFYGIVEKIRDNSVFKNRSNFSQADPAEQFMIALGRFGFDGSASSLWKDGAYFGVGEGTVNLYTERVLYALLSLESETVVWPKTVERAQIKRRIETAHKFRNCIGYVDGTLVGLEEKPAGSGEDYFSRESGYAINAMIVVDDQKIIRHVYAGWPGGAHDHRVFTYSKLARIPSDYFTNGEYLLADSAYPTSDITVPTYKKPAADIAENRTFNVIHAEARVAVEHTIGILKGRFKSLKRLRLHIKDKNDLAWGVYWIRACCILHNLLDNDPYDDEWTEVEAAANEEDELENLGAIHLQSDSCESGRLRREAVKQSVLGQL